MDACLRSRVNTSYHSRRNQAYETTYKRVFSSKRPARIVEGAPLSQRFLIGCPFILTDPVGESIYTMDFARKTKEERKPSVYQSTSVLEQPDSQQPLPSFPRRSESFNDTVSDEIKQALRNQLDSTYRVDYTGKCALFKESVVIRFFLLRIMPRISTATGL
jgi:hypothetical protein